MGSSDTEKENQLLEDDSQEGFLNWWRSRVQLRCFIPRTLIHEEAAGEVSEAAYKAGWRAAKLSEGYHEYKPPIHQWYFHGSLGGSRASMNEVMCPACWRMQLVEQGKIVTHRTKRRRKYDPLFICEGSNLCVRSKSTSQGNEGKQGK